MKRKRALRALHMLLALALFLSFPSPVLALGERSPGETFTITVPLGVVSSVNVSITASRPDVAAVTDVQLAGALTGLVSNGRVNVSGETAESCSILLTVQVAADAAPGAEAAISVDGFVKYGVLFDDSAFRYSLPITIPAEAEPEKKNEESDVDGREPGEAPGPSDGGSVTKQNGEEQNTTPGYTSGTGSQPAETPSDSDEPAAGRSGVTQLLQQAAELNEAAYSAESWKALTEAMDRASAAVELGDAEAAEAAEALETALAGLEPMDYSRADALVAAVDLLLEGNLTVELADKLREIESRAKELYALRDQEELDEASEGLTRELNTRMEEMGWRGESKGDYPLQEGDQSLLPLETQAPEEERLQGLPRLDPKSLIILAAVLLVLGVTLGIVIPRQVRKARNQKDTTPMVDYDIFDDE